MTTALAFAGVTAVLRDLLNDGLVNHNVSGVIGSTVTVSALAPDRVVAAGAAEPAQLNLFLYLVTPNAALRNRDLPSRDASGTRRLTNPPLALDLHYMVSAYGAADLQAEILLGYAMQLLHEHPVLPRASIRAALTPSPDVGVVLPPALRALAASGLADQLEQIRISPHAMSTEEMARLWSAMQTHYRPSATYLATVVLIEAERPTVSPLPVLTRGPVDPATLRERGVVVVPDLVPPLPTIERVLGPDGQSAARLGDVVTLEGVRLDGTAREVLLENDRFQIAETLPATGPSAPDRVQFTIPLARSADFPAGVYRISARLVPTGEAQPRRTNGLALLVRPSIAGLPMTVARDGAGTASFTLTVSPHVRPAQPVALVLGMSETIPAPVSAPSNTLAFTVPNAAVGNHLARLRVDGIDSEILDRTATPPVFLDQRIQVT